MQYSYYSFFLKKRINDRVPVNSGAETILEQGGQDRERQSQSGTRNKVLRCPKNKCSLKKKGLRLIRSVFLSFYPKDRRSPTIKIKKGLRRIKSVFLSQKWLRIQVLGGAKVTQGGPKCLQGGSCPPTSCAYASER